MTSKRFIIFQDSYDDLYIQDKEVYRATGIKVGNEEDVKYENVSKIVEILNELHEENEHYKSIFFELVETALTDKNCRELYCKGILDIFDKANSLNQAREMIKGHLK